MHPVLAMSVACVLFATAAAAAEAACDTDVPAQINRNSRTGIVLTTGIDGFKVGQPAPPELLEKLGSLLCAAGSEELKVIDVGDRSYFGDPARHAERSIRLVESIGGHAVRPGFVNISLNIETHEVMMLFANFLPDRGLDHKPQLTAAQAKAKVETAMGSSSTVELGSGERTKIAFNDTPAQLAYDVEAAWGFRPTRGMLVWVLGANGVDHTQIYQVSISAATGEVIALHGMLWN